jgi:uncharacterized protein YdeI (YjbR/CyaY-like superfamily)
MATRDPRVDAYIAKAQPFAKPILTRIRKAVHAGCPGVIETIKWSVPAFEYKGPMCGMAAFKAHCIFGFWKGALMKRTPKDRAAAAMGQFARFETLADLPSEAAMVRMVKEAAALNDAGVKVPRGTTAKTALKAPREMLAAIRKNPRAQQAYSTFSPSAKREYIEWITGAKSDATRARRLDTAVQWISEGKTRHWKYMPAARRARPAPRA